MKQKFYQLFFVMMFGSILLIVGAIANLFGFNNFLLHDSVNDTVWAQTQEDLIAQLAIEQFNAQFTELSVGQINITESDISYSPYEVSHVEVIDNWARIHITSLPDVTIDNRGNLYAPHFQGAVAKRVNGEWVIYFERTPSFSTIVPKLPVWLSFLDIKPSEITTVDLPFSVPALPWEVETSWRYNQGLHDDFNGTQTAFDFGTPLQEDRSNAVHAVDSGEVIDAHSTCILIQRSDGLQVRYQHINSNDVADFSTGNYVNMGDYLGQTTTVDGCGGSSDGHHVHIEFYDQNGNSINPSYNGGSFLNEWHVSSSDGDLTKQNTTIESPTSPPYQGVYHKGCPTRAISSQLLVMYGGKNCTGTDWSTNLINQLVYPPNWVYPYSLDLQDGYSVELYSAQSNPLYACYSGDLWDMTKDYYPGTSALIAGNVGSLIIRAGGCQCQTSATSDDVMATTNCDPSSPPPPDEPPLPPGPQQETTVKLFAYANYDGSVLFSGKEGFSNVPDANGYSLEIPSGWSVITYDQDNGEGVSRCWNSNVPNLQDHSWHLRIQSLQIFEGRDMCPTSPPSSPTDQVFLYSNPNYSAQLWGGGTGFHDYISQDAESMKIPAGWSAFVYEGDKRQIRAQCFNGNVPNLALTNSWQNKIRGIEVFNTDLCQDMLVGSNNVFRMYLDEGLTGSYLYADGIVEINDMRPWDYNDKVSSIRIKAGYSIRVWEHNDFQGGSRCFSEDITTVRNDAFDNGVAIYAGEGTELDSRISSFKVYDNHYCDGSPAMPESGWAYSNAPSAFARTQAENDNQSITINWIDSSYGEWGFHIYEYDQNNNYTLVGTVGTGATSFTHTGLQCGTTYNYQVKSYNQWGESATPYLISASTAACALPPPIAPSNLRVVNKTHTSVLLAWSDNSIDEDYFNIWEYRDGSYFYHGTANQNATSYNVTGLSCNTSYVFEVDAVNGNGYAESNYISVTTNICYNVYLPMIKK